MAWCLEVHDLWLSKALALRPKAIEFCAALVAHGHVDPETLDARLGAMSGITEDRRRSVRALIDLPAQA